MKKSEPKMILNVQINNDELEEKVKIAMDKYAEDLILKNLDDKIRRIIMTRIDRLINGNRWSSDSKIDGTTLEDYVKEKSEKAIKDAIEKHIKDIFAKKIAEML